MSHKTQSLIHTQKQQNQQNQKIKTTKPTTTTTYLKTLSKQMGCQLMNDIPNQNNLTMIANYCKTTGLGQGFLCTKGKDHFKFRDGYRLKDTFLTVCVDKNNTTNILGFVMWSLKFCTTKHKNIKFDDINLVDIKKQLHNTCVILNLCAKSEIKGVGSLLLLWAMCSAQKYNPKNYNGSVLFVGKKRVCFSIDNDNENSDNQVTKIGPFYFSTHSGICLYKKFGFKPITAHQYYRKNKRKKNYNEYLIMYRKEFFDTNFIDLLLSKYILT